MTPDEFKAMRERLGLSFDEIGEALGLTGRAIRYYEAGQRPIPKTVELAMQAYAVQTELQKKAWEALARASPIPELGSGRK